MDEADQAQLRQEVEEARLFAARSRDVAMNRGPWSNCRNCGARLEDARRESGFCDRDCGDDHAYRDAARQRNEGGR